MLIRQNMSARLLATTAIITAMGGTAYAQADTQAEPQTNGGLADIVVTATRRATNVQDVPIAVTAVGGAQLQAQGITDGVQLSRIVPNLFTTTGYAGGNLRYAIRGLGMTDFSQAGGSPVATYVDDVYQPYNFGIGSQLFDLDRVEVLRGPQGTLFGRNTTGGAVTYYSARPTDAWEGYVNADVMWGQFSKYTAEGMVNAPLVADTLSMRASVRFERREPFVENVLGGRDLGRNESIAGRVQFEWTPADTTKVNLKLEATNSTGDSTLYHGGFISNICDPGNFDESNTPYANCIGTDLPPTYENVNAVADEVRGFERYHNYGATLRVDHEAGDWNLASISNYKKIVYDIVTNDDGNDTDFFHSRQKLNAWQISQEFRVATPADQPISAVFGIFGQYDKADSPSATGSTVFGPSGDYVLRTDAIQKTTALAAFTNVTFELSRQLSFVGGLRYSWERKKIDLQGMNKFFGFDFDSDNYIDFDINNPPFALDGPLDDIFAQKQKNTWKRLTWDGTLNFKPNDDILLYAKIAEGFRSGGYNIFASLRSSVSTVEPEILRSYELGFKSELFDRRLRLNAAAFYFDLSDQQIQVTGASGPGIFLSNAGASTIKGFEIEAEAAPVDRLRLTAALGYTHATFDRFETIKGGVAVNLKGNTLAYAPRWTASGSASYDFDLGNDYGLQLGTDWSYRTQVYFDSFNVPYTGDNHLLLGNARITLTSPEHLGQWHISAYVNNLTNKEYHNFGFFTGNAWYSRTFGDKRIWGLRAGLKF